MSLVFIEFLIEGVIFGNLVSFFIDIVLVLVVWFDWVDLIF